MELIAAIVFAGPLGFFVRSRPLLAYLVIWAVIFPVQTVSVHDEGNLDATYWPVNAVILALGIALNHLGCRLRARRAARLGSLA